jgi:hypothetical protein
MDGVETLGLFFRDGLLFDGNDLKSGSLDLGQYCPSVAFADRVRLDDAEGALRHVVCSLRKICACDFIVIVNSCGCFLRLRSDRVSACFDFPRRIALWSF